MALKTVSLDEISETHMQKYLKSHSGSNKIEALRHTRNEASQDFDNMINLNLSTTPAKGLNGTILFLDKPYLPGEFEQVFNLIDSHSNKNVRKIALKPIIQQTHEDYPFSLKFLVQCINRELYNDRFTKVHQSKYLTKLLILHFKAFQGNTLSTDELTKDNDFDSILSAPFSPLDLEPRFNLSNDISELLQRILATPNEQLDDSGFINNLNQLLDFNRMFYGASVQSAEPKSDAKLLGELRECVAQADQAAKQRQSKIQIPVPEEVKEVKQ